MANYTRAHYLKIADASHVDRFYQYVSELESLAAAQGWNLEKNFRSSWCSFGKPSSRNVAFGIGLRENGAYLYIKRVKENADAFSIKYSNYSEAYDQVEYELEPGKPQLDRFVPLLALGYKRSLE